MKSKILQKLRNRYATLGLGNKALNGVASFLEKTVAKEEDIDSAIDTDDVRSLLSAIQGETDALRNENARLTKENETLKGESKEPPKKGADDETRQAIADMQAQIKAFLDKSAAAEKKASDEAMMTRAREIMKSKGCDNDFILNVSLAGATIAEGDTAETIAEKYRTAYDANFKQAYGDGYIPPKGSPTPKGYKKGDFSSEVERLRAEGKIPAESK